MTTYRNIFFNKSSFTVGNGYEEIYYTGKIYDNATTRSDFFQIYDKEKDLVISCNACAKKNIKFIRKVGTTFIESKIMEQSSHTPKTKAKITKKVSHKEVLIPIKQKKCKHC